VQEADGTVAVTVVGAGLNFVEEKDTRSFQHTTAIVAGSGLRSGIEGIGGGSYIGLT
jgi:hypothetical protein